MSLDGTPATLRLLPEIAEAIDGRIELYLDGGVRRGSDVVKAVALGARACLIGRPYIWGLAAAGEAGVRRVLEILRGGVDLTLGSLGVASLQDLDPSLLVVPPEWDAPIIHSYQRTARSS
jgi:isopentenyl diphosphate isomerase/L-lactate dehydrogenase-like FMN-dependent dehydrogenase